MNNLIKSVLITLTMSLTLTSCNKKEEPVKTDLDIAKEEAYEYIDNLPKILDIDKEFAKSHVEDAENFQEINKIKEDLDRKVDLWVDRDSNGPIPSDPEELEAYKEKSLTYIDEHLNDFKCRGDLIRTVKYATNINIIRNDFAQYDLLEDLEEYINE